MSMRILLFGKYGQLGWELERTLACLGEVRAIDYPEVDFTHPQSLPGIVREVQPGLIVNAIAYTDVDKAESEQEKARIVNTTSVGVLAEEAHRLGIPFIHYSTEYVFDGRKSTPYVESDETHPLNVYGSTKLEGERVVCEIGGAYLVLRTSWVYSLRKGGFVNKVLEWAKTKEVLRIVDDQVGSPTWARMLAEISASILARGWEDIHSYVCQNAGIYHVTGNESCSRYEWAKETLHCAGIGSEVSKVLPAKSTDFPSPAIRPMNSALDCTKVSIAFKVHMMPWKTALHLAMDGIGFK